MEATTKETFPVMENNVSKVEQGISILSGSYLLYRALQKGSFLQAGIAGYLLFRGVTGYCPAYQYTGKTEVLKNHNINTKVSITIKKPRAEVYSFWRRLENLPLFMKHLQEVHSIDEKYSEWKAAIPGEMGTIDWISEIVEDQENERIGWQSKPGSDIENAGNVHFKDAGKFGTEVHAVISYKPTGGKAGEALGRFLNPVIEKMVKEDIRNFRRFMESGEIPTIEGQPSGGKHSYISQI